MLKRYEDAKRCRVITINRSWELYPNASFHYACDLKWWNTYGKECKATGERWTADPQAAVNFHLRRVILLPFHGLCRDRHCVNSGGNSGYQAVNLAYHLGASSIALVGYDMHRKNKGHFFGDYPNGMLSAPQTHVEAWRGFFPALAHDLAKARIRTVNCTPGSALDCFPRQSLYDFLRKAN